MAKKKITPDDSKKDDNVSDPKYTVVFPTKLPPQYAAPQSAQESVDNFTNQINSTGTVLGGSIEALSQRIDSFEHFLVQPDLENQINERISPVKKELELIKNEILPQLQQSQQALISLEEFMRNNVTFLKDLTIAEGKLDSFKDEISSLSRRLEKVESDKAISWNKAATIISVVVAILSMSIAAYVAFIKQES